MTALELLDAIGDVQGKYILEAQSARTPRPRSRASKLRILLVAAAMALLLAGCTYAVMKLQSLKIDEYTPTVPNMANVTQPAHDVISLQGFAGSPGYLAAKEWRAFKSGLDPEASGDFQAPDDYYAYSCTSQEMVDKADEICQKYNLRLLGQSVHRQLTHYELFPALRIEDIFLPDANVAQELTGGYYYTDGSFQLSGTVRLDERQDWPYVIEFQFRSVKKQSFDATCLDIGRIEDYDEWEYGTASGAEALLAQGPAYGLILVDGGDSFITVTVLNSHVGDLLYGERWMTRGNLEAFADSFDLSLRTTPPPETPNEETAEIRRYMTMLGMNPRDFEGSRIVYDYLVYTFRSPDAGIGYEGSEYVGRLAFDPDFPMTSLVTDSANLHGMEVWHLIGGSLGDALMVGPEIGRKMLYVPETVEYPSDYEYVENDDGGITVTKYRGNAEFVEVPREIDGKSVTRIGHIGETGGGAFSNCPRLVELTIPEGVTLVDDCSFWGCYNLRSIRFPASLTGIGHSAFNECPMLTDLWFAGNAPAHGNYLFDFYPQDVGLPKINLHYQQGSSGWGEDSLWTYFEHKQGETQ